MPPSWLRVDRKRLICIGVVFLAAATRVLYLLVTKPSYEGYGWSLADSLIRFGSLGSDGNKTTQFEPLYPLFLAITRTITADHVRLVRVVQAVIDSVGAAYLYGLASRLTGSPRIALFCAVLYACNPLLVRHSVVLNEASLLSTLVIVFAYAITTADTLTRAAAAGVCLGLCILIRTMISPVLVLTAATLITTRRTKMALSCVVAAAMVVSPWMIRNYRLNGALWPTRSGVNLLLGNSPYTAALLPDYDPDVLLSTSYVEAMLDGQPALQADTVANEKARDSFFTARAVEAMRARPFAAAQLMFRKLAYFFWPRLVPSHVITAETHATLEADGHVRVENSPERPPLDALAYTVSYSLLAIAAIVGVCVRRSELHRDAILWWVVLTFVATHVIYFPATRYQVPLEFVLLFYAAVGTDAVVGLRPKWRAIT